MADKKTMNAEERDEIRALSQRRAEITEQMLRLDELFDLPQLRDAPEMPDEGTPQATLNDVSLFCVGACLALWRAAFLVHTEDKRRATGLRTSAREVLRELARHNRFTYPEETQTSPWLGGYYINNARWRLKDAIALIGADPDGDAADAWAGIKDHQHFNHTVVAWAQCFRVLRWIIDRLHRQVVAKYPSPT